jgi:succinoglycan biosynthesis transport protein ExoP
VPELEERGLHEGLDNVIGLLTRRKWWILVAACATALVTVAVALRLPDRYSSEATLVVVQQQISQRFVQSETTTTAADAIQSMTREILSRTRLLGIIDELGLYAKERQRLTREQLAELMQKDVDVEPLDQRNDFAAFTISFSAENPQLAQSVASRLTSLFIEENLKAQGERATRTNSFLAEQLEAAKKKLEDQERRLTEFKTRNLTELPEQQQANLASLTDLRIQLQSTVASLNRAQQQRASLEAVISGNLALMQSERSELLTRFTLRNSEVIKKDQQIARIQALLDHLKTGNSGADNLVIGATPDDPLVVQWRSQIDANLSETDNLSKEEQRLRGEVATYQSRLNLSPVREQELSGIVRDYDSYRKDYTDLLNSQLQSQLAVNLEERQEGQQFRLVDPPTLPVFPSSPKRLKICLGGAAGGVFLGLALAFLMEMKSPSFHLEKELRQSVAVPLVLGVPLMLTSAEERARSWKTAFGILVTSVMTIAVLAAEFYVYRHG